jgi:hypothetical protein
MKIILSMLVAGIAILTVTLTLSRAESLEYQYYETRNSLIRLFEEMSEPVDDSLALVELEEKLKNIVGSVSIEGFPKQGKINLLTLKNDIDIGQVDGLRFESDEETLVVTTKNLLAVYLSEHPGLPETLNELSTTGDFYRLVFHPDAGVAYYSEIPVTIKNGQSFGHAFLGLSSQETIPFIPPEIFVFVATEQHVFIANTPTVVEITDIVECRREWETFYRKSSTALEIYQKSRLEDENALNDYFRYRDQGFEAFKGCFARMAKEQTFFASLEKQAQSIVDRLLKCEFE